MDEYQAEVESKVLKVLDMGRSWGMTEEEIQECLQEVVQSASQEEKGQDKQKGSPRGSWIWSVGKYIFLVPFVVFLLYSTVMICAAVSPELENKLGKATAPLVYPTVRQIRILFKPLADALNLGGYYSSDCLVSNPFFLDQVEDCQPCHSIRRFSDLTGQNATRLRKYILDIQPFIIKGYSEGGIDFSVLKKMYVDNEARFVLGGTIGLETNLRDVYNISDLLLKYDEKKLLEYGRQTGYAIWETNSVPSSQAIRKVFPRPSFLSSASEVSLLKRIYIDSPLVGTHELALGGFSDLWYHQVSGTRHLTLVPHPECSKECVEVEVTVEAGDLVYFQDQFWKMLSDPVIVQGTGKAATQDISIAFCGSFTVSN